MLKVCKNCGYERVPTDFAPDYECPKCGAIYAKVEARLKWQAVTANSVKSASCPDRNKIMYVLSSKQVTNRLGPSTAKSLIGAVNYLGGFADVDALYKAKEINFANFDIRPKGVEYTFRTKNTGLLSPERKAFLFNKINYWSIENTEEIVAKKSKSIVGRAILGGLLIGPLGALVGGMTGIGGSDVRISDFDNILTLSVKNRGKDVLVLFSVTNKKLGNVLKFFKLHLADKYKSKEELTKKETVAVTYDTDIFSVADELKKLKNLQEQGVLSVEEFEAQKSKMLRL